MFEKIVDVAERSATRASRRQFLGRIGRGALFTAGVVGGFLAFGSEARAGRRRRRCTTDTCCPRGYICEDGRCVKGVRPQVCSTDSQVPGQCRGRAEGSVCGTPNRPGRCVGAPDCRCVLVNRR